MNEAPPNYNPDLIARVTVESDDNGETKFVLYDPAQHGTEPMNKLAAAYEAFITSKAGKKLQRVDEGCPLRKHMSAAIRTIGHIDDIKVDPLDKNMKESRWSGGYWVIDPGGYSAQFPVQTTLRDGVRGYWIGFEPKPMHGAGDQS